MFLIFLLCQFIEFQNCHQATSHDIRAVYNSHTVLLYGNSSLGYYYMNIYVGENKTKHSVIVDTGSQTTTINCNQCAQCGQHINPPYQFEEINYNSSDLRIDFNCSSFQQNKCNFSYCDEKGSTIEGFYFKDKVLLGDELNQINNKFEQESFELILGCTQFESEKLKHQLADGILGIAPIMNNTQNPPNLIDVILRADDTKSIQRQFSICLNDNHGYLKIGGYDNKKNGRDFNLKVIKFNPIQFYQINLKKIKFGDQFLFIDKIIYTKGQGTFMDSGSSISYMNKNTYEQLLVAITHHISINNIPIKIIILNQICFQFFGNISISDYYLYFPTMKFFFDDNIEIDWTPQNYLNLQDQQVCIGIEQQSNRVILGQNWMRNKEIQFDLEQQEIAIVSTNCTLDQFTFQTLEQQNDEVSKNFRLMSVLRSTLGNEQNESNDQEDEGTNEVKNERVDEHSWLEILFYIFIVVITLKGLIFLGLYIMKRLGGNLYTYQQKAQKFQKLNNQIHLDEDEGDERVSKQHKIELIIKQSDNIE